MTSQALKRTEKALQTVVFNQPIVLPLFTASGKPFWYYSTDKVKILSEKLSTLIASLPEAESPVVSTAMPSAAAEAYYSSALDGEANSSLNTQKALLNALQHIHEPIDASLATTLMRDITGAAPILRTTLFDAAPAPSTIPWHMNCLYAFLADDRYHPLIKASVTHGFLLAVQPFQTGNGRLARMLTLIILLRSGHSFLLENSLSAVIAKHGQDYIKALRSIFLPEKNTSQAGYLGSFIEYILEMLVETGSAAAHPPVDGSSPGNDEENHKTNTPARSSTAKEQSVPFHDRLRKLDVSSSPVLKRSATVIRDMINAGIIDFTLHEWLEHSDMSYREFDSCRNSLRRYGIIKPLHRTIRNKCTLVLYRFCVDQQARGDEGNDSSVDDRLPKGDSLQIKLVILETSNTPLAVRASSIIRDMVNNGVFEFMKHDWIKKTGMTSKEFDACRALLKRYKIIKRGKMIKSNGKAVALYSIISEPSTPSDEDTPQLLDADEADPEKRQEEQQCETDTGDSPFFTRLADMEISRHEHLRKTAAIVRSFLKEGILAFSNLDWMHKNSVSSHEFDKSRKCLAKREMIIKDPAVNRRTSRYLFMVPYNPEILNNPVLRVKVFDSHKVLTAAQFWAQVDSLDQSRSALTRSLATIVRDMIAEGITGYTTNQWVARTGMSMIDYSCCRNRLYAKHLIYGVREYKTDSGGNTRTVRATLFRFTLEGLEYSQDPVQHSEKTAIPELTVEEFVTQIESMELSRSLVVRQSAELIRKKISAHSMTFTEEEWMQALGLSKNQFSICIQSMRSRRVVCCCSRNTYLFNIPADTVLPERKPGNRIHSEDYQPALQLLKELSPIDRIDEKVAAILINPIRRFRIEDWQQANGISLEEARNDLKSMIQMGLTSFRSRLSSYSFCFRSPDELIRKIHLGTIHKPYDSDTGAGENYHEPLRFDFWAELANIDNSPSPLIRSIAPVIKSFLDRGMQYFTTGILVKEAGINDYQCYSIIKTLKRNRVIEECSYFDGKAGCKRHQGFYRILYGDGESKADIADLIGIHGSVPQETINRIEEMKNGQNHEKRLGEFLVQMMNQNRICFTLYEYAQHYDLTLAGLTMDLYHGLDIGILDHKVALCRTVYYISTEPIPTIRVKGLTDEMKRMLTHIYQEYGQNDFLSTVILGKITERKWLHRLIDRGIMYRERRGAQYYSRLLISPQSHPECFVSSDSMAKHKPHYT